MRRTEPPGPPEPVLVVTARPQRARPAGRPPPRHAAPAVRRGLGAYSLALAAVAVLVPLHRWWAAQVLLVPLLLIAPGSILLQALRIPSRVVKSFPVYVPCASIIVLFGSGLAVDIIGPLAGAAEPLRPVPLLVGFEVICFALLAASPPPPPTSHRLAAAVAPVRPPWPLALPLVAAAGASGSTATTATRGGGLRRGDRGHGRVPPRCPPGWTKRCSRWCSTPRAWPWCGPTRCAATALRVRHIHRVPTAAADHIHGIWHPAHPNDAYGAMLSVTVMPAELHALCGVPGSARLQGHLPDDLRPFPGRDLRPGAQDPFAAVGISRPPSPSASTPSPR